MREDTLPHKFLVQVNKLGPRVALREKKFGVWQEITWDDYCRHVRHFCLGLMELGLERGAHVSILADNEPKWLIADIATQSAGAVAVGVYPTNPSREARYVVGHSESTFVVCGDQEQLDKILEVKEELPLLKRIVVMDLKGLRNYTDPLIVSFEAVEEMGRNVDEKDPEKFYRITDLLKPEDVAIMVYTSGTTGPPKGAVITHGNIGAAMKMLDVVPIEAHDHGFLFLPLAHVYPRLVIWMAMHVGFAVGFALARGEALRAAAEMHPDFLIVVPRFLERLRRGLEQEVDRGPFWRRGGLRWAFEVGHERSDALAEGNVPLLLGLQHRVADALFHVPLRERLGGRLQEMLVVMITTRKTNLGMGWVALRSALSEIAPHCP